MGPNFNSGKTRIGRQRLTDGLVAILDDPESLRGALLELHAYAMDVRIPNRPRRGIVYRVVSDAESLAIRYKLQNLLGMKRFLLEESTYTVPTGHWHFVDDRALSHAQTRHGLSRAESLAGQVALSATDFCLIPEIVHSANIVEFSVAKGMPRIMYERSIGDGTLIVVEEIHSKAGLSFKTCYKQK